VVLVDLYPISEFVVIAAAEVGGLSYCFEFAVFKHSECFDSEVSLLC
jgi:hypothetical protein